MALTRITRGVIKPNENYDTHNIVSTGIVTWIGLDVNGNADISGSLSVGGVLTYEDVTCVDSIGIITARTGLVSPYADIDDFVSVGSNIHLGNAGVITATSFVGDGSNLTNTGSTLSEPSSGTQRLVTTSLTTGTMTSSGTGSELAFDYANNHLEFSDGTRATFGTDNDLQLYHSGSNAFLTNSTGFFRVAATTTGGGLYLDGSSVFIRSEAGDENLARFINDGAVELYHNNEKKLYTYGEGVFIQDDSSAGAYLVLATNAGTQGSLYGTANTLGFLDGQNHYMLKGVKDGTVELYFDNSKKFETLSSGAKVSGALNVTTQISSGDITITSSQPMLFLQDNGNDPDWSVKNGNGNFFIRDETNSAVRFAINQNSNIEFYGDAVPSANNTHDLGTTSLRWRNIYTNDLNLSNEGGKNNVDGTWGNYTIQEGESDLFLINNRNGKKYKFNLTEVS